MTALAQTAVRNIGVQRVLPDLTVCPLVPLSRAIRQRKEFITINDSEHFKRCRVQLNAKGVLLRDTVSGADIKTKKQQVCRPGEFLVAEIDAKVGGFGIVPDELDGAVVSSHYFLFVIDPQQLDIRYLDFYCRSARFRSQVEAQGSTNYAAIRPSDVLAYTIPLPSLSEQQQLAAHFEALTKKTREVDDHLAAVERDAEHILALSFRDAITHAPMRSMAEVAPLIRREISIALDSTYPELGIRSFGKGTFHKPSLSGSEVGNKRLFQIEPGDLLFSNVFAWEGAIAIARPEDIGRVGSHRFITCKVDPESASAVFLRYYFLTDRGLIKIGEASPGGAGRNRTLGLEKLMAIEVPVPPLPVQEHFDRLYAYVAALKAKHTAIRQASVALLPATLERVFASA